MATAEELTQRRKDAIKRRMERTRARLAGRLNTLGDTVQGVRETVESTVESVQDTVANVQETVQGTVESVQNTVSATVDTAREYLDFRQHPMLWMGGSVVAGYLGGLWLHSRDRTPAAPAYPPGYPYYGPVPTPPPAAPPAEAAKPEQNGLLDGLKGMFGEYIDQLKGLGIGAGIGLLRDLVASEVPEGMRKDIQEMGDNLIKDLGGQVLEPNLIDPQCLVGEPKSTSSGHPAGSRAESPRAPTRREGQPVVAAPY